MTFDYAKWEKVFKVKADETNDHHDHDELHAAAELCACQNLYIIDIRGNTYIERWLKGLIKLHKLES